MMVREPVVAGQFYPARADACRAQLLELIGEATPGAEIDGTVLGGLVPHAGWRCSGAVAARVFNGLATCGADCQPVSTRIGSSHHATRSPKVIVLFSGVHRYRGKQAAMFGSGRWETPMGPVEIDGRLAERILGHTNQIIDDPYAHEDEHSLVVLMPFLRYLFPEAKVVPIMVPTVKSAAEIGEAVGRTLKSYRYDALVIGTTDLTHYGPRYNFVPQGVGVKGNVWAKEDNDRRFIDLVCDMRASELVPEATTRRNACSSGAAAATIAACRVLGATTGILLQHTTSSEVLADTVPGEQADSVGYAGIVFA